MEVLFPQNWSFNKVESTGLLYLSVAGDMILDFSKSVPVPVVSPLATASPGSGTPAPGQNPSSSPLITPGSTSSPVISPSPKPVKNVILSYPINPITREESVTTEIPPEKLLYFITALGILTVILIPAAFVYQVLVPISVTLKLGDKSRAFRLSNGGKISIGGLSDFEVPGVDHTVAEIQRRFRRFVLHQKEEGIIPKTSSQDSNQICLKLGEGFSLNISGTYHEFEFLPGNREFEEEIPQHDNHDDIDEGPAEFRF
jgi:hypothetical protein